MIFFGTKGKTIEGDIIDGIQCPNCEKTQFISFGALKYFHLYWIPTFVTSRSVGMECTHCKRTLVDDELPGDVIKLLKGTLFNKRNTIPMFSGLIIILCLIMFGVHAGKQDAIKESAYMDYPLINDLYIVDFDKIFTDVDPTYKYGVMRLRDYSYGDIEFQVSKLVYNKTSGVFSDIRNGKTSSDEYYDSEVLFIDSGKLHEWKDSGAIYSIERI